jgi:acyl-coenzyme A thioesterase PaaI-like protein
MFIDIPYAQWMGIVLQEDDQGRFFLLPFQKKHIGNTLLPALHGGLLGGFMECSAQAYWLESSGLDYLPKTINFSIDYLRSGRAKDTWARCHITKQGRRVVHVSVHAWQDEAERPIAVARAHFLLQENHPSR